jgi:hypothetical protein
MESTSEPTKIHISQTTHELLGPDYLTADRGEIVVKGKGIDISLEPPATPKSSLIPFCIDLHDSYLHNVDSLVLYIWMSCGNSPWTLYLSLAR